MGRGARAPKPTIHDEYQVYLLAVCVPLGLAFTRDFGGFAEFGDGKKENNANHRKSGMNHRNQ